MESFPEFLFRLTEKLVIYFKILKDMHTVNFRNVFQLKIKKLCLWQYTICVHLFLLNNMLDFPQFTDLTLNIYLKAAILIYNRTNSYFTGIFFFLSYAGRLDSGCCACRGRYLPLGYLSSPLNCLYRTWTDISYKDYAIIPNIKHFQLDFSDTWSPIFVLKAYSPFIPLNDVGYLR